MTRRLALAPFALARFCFASPSFAGYAEWHTEEQAEKTDWVQALCGIVPTPAFMCDNTQA